MDRIETWLAEAPVRATVINAVMLSVILAMLNTPALYTVVGGGTVLLAGAWFTLNALRRSLAQSHTIRLPQLAVIWLPGIVAVGVALVALHLVTSEVSTGVSYGVGAVLFTAQLVALILLASGMSGQSIGPEAVARAR